MIRHIAEHEFKLLVLESNKPLVIVDFWAPWCKPCQYLNPILESISRRFTMNLDIIKINIDDEFRIAQQFGVKSVPTMLFFQNGNIVERITGAKDEMSLVGTIANLLKNIKI